MSPRQRYYRQLMRGTVLLLLAATQSMSAQSTATVPASSDVYERIEAVSAWYPTRGVFLGERPMSIRDAARVVEALSRRIEQAAPTPRREWAQAQIRALRTALSAASDPARGVRWSWRTDALGTNARVERIRPNGLGGIDTTSGEFIGIDALRHSFDAAREGIPASAATLLVLPTVSAGGTAAAVIVEPLIATGGARADSGRWSPAFHRAYVRGVWHNAAIRAGADEMRWGQSATGALFISGNAAPLHALTIGTDTPVTLPWLLRHAGAFRLSGMLADLGEGFPSHARLAGWQGSIQPWSTFELGVAVLSHTGGGGSPRATFFERVVDLFPVIDALAPQHADLQISNKIAGGNLRLRIPQLSGTDFYYELAIDDFDARRLRSSLVEDAGHLLGIRVPTFAGARPVTWRAEWQRTSLRLYEHSQYPSGVTYHQRLIGNPLGPNAKGASLDVRIDLDAASTLELAAADERRNPSIFLGASNDALDHGFRFVLDSLIPDYRRQRLTASLERAMGGMTAGVVVGFARSWQETSSRRTEWLMELRVRRDRLRTF
ncbi:MAG TPA: capsule assembly Wzi family protein [Gemmatimonadaceae bacterium]|nr:capsule assembly Wzi family protein [Gemmatimonadaceae bacterium]